MKTINILSCIFILIIVIANISCANPYVDKGENMGVSLEKAILIAKDKLVSLNYDIQNKKIIADVSNSTWNKYSSDKTLETNLHIQNMLKGRSFWAIQFVPTEPVLGGIIFVFINKENGEIIGILPLK